MTNNANDTDDGPNDEIPLRLAVSDVGNDTTSTNLFESLDKFADDFMEERSQPVSEDRTDIFS